MSAIWRTVLLLLVIQAQQAIAGTQNVTIEVGGKAVFVPTPVGFHEISQLSPETRKLMETMTPPNNRLLAVFVSEDDVGRIMLMGSPEFLRYMLLQVNRELEHFDISGAQFSQLISQFKQDHNNLLEKVKDTYDY